MNDIHRPGPQDPDDIDPGLERRLAAALRDEFPVEPVTDEEITRLRTALGTATDDPGPGGAGTLEPAVPILSGTPPRHRSRAWRTGLLAAAAVAVVGLISVSTTLWTTAAPEPTPADAPTVSTTAPVVSDDPSVPAPFTTGATTVPSAADPAVEVPIPTTAAPVITAEGPVTTVEAPLTTPAAPVTPAAPATTGGSPGAVVPADPPGFRVDDTRYEVPGMIEFRSPSGNLYCLMADEGVPGATCQVFTADYATERCPDDTGATNLGMVVSVDGAGETSDGSRTTADTVGRYSEACGYGLVATSGAPPASARVLDYGRSLTYGGFSCVSETSGVTCRNDDNGAGFSVSRAAYRLF